ncbi:MAG: site-specific integrase [Candidatus Thermoplasmatota archaeon]|nr:site-specific integrase [Candidatus Thermoplasmatota archaeon]
MTIYRDTLEAELSRNVRLIPDVKAVDKIRRFAMELKASGLTDYRVIFYVVRLRKLTRILGSSFLNPSKDDVIKAINTLQNDPKVSPRTVEDYKQAMRKFYSLTLSKKTYGQVMTDIHMKNNANRTKKSADMITDAEMEKILQNAMNPRDKALFSLLHDSGCRVGEVLTLHIHDVKFDQYGALIHVVGKTGERNVRIVGNSIAYLRDWLRAHPSGNPDSLLFVGINGDKSGQPLDYDTMRSALRKTCKRAGITKRIHPHLFRHSKATQLAGVLSDSVLKKSMGWSGGSRMAAVYVHLNDTETDRAILEAHGIDIEKNTIQVQKPINCPRCAMLQPSYAKICTNCFMILDQAVAINTTLSMDIELDPKQEIPGTLTGKIQNYDSLKPLLIMIQEMQKSMDDLRRQLKK